ncbi:N-acetyldiaminopimelate deacetylase [Enterococcus sp. JM4C]|uniref:N-acetyldiaminopimelate deacetylase n=1 Tax=Candidatus Enterococcus huntleyi TaxID=1857217 RepID=UPI00137A6472|nr:N-acetyldiaminopimelate deacetylase [Enterococcus sp. JM4C]KAF1296599.1 N-acetyldiaminopimelate deacetylase [Enterococcus sp. JM4C]
MSIQPRLVEIRRALHKIPEIGLHEVKTSEFLLTQIDLLQKEYIEVRKWQTGILVYVKGFQPTKTIGWRTDIDGLPIKELVKSSFTSKHEGFMHACGHDFHMTIALGLLENLSAVQPKNNFLFLFQPAEENDAGGMLMYNDGAFGDWLPDEFYGLHVAPELPVGTISTRSGTLFAGTCEVRITLRGTSGHAAFPHLANDMIVAATQLVQQAQTIISRSVDPIQGGVITFGSFHAGQTNNVIAGEAELFGTIRSLTQEVNELTQKRLREIVQGIEKSFQCDIELSLEQKGYLPVNNNPRTTQRFIEFMENQPLVQFKEAQSAMTGEDFGFLLSKVPGTMFWLGVDSPYGLHHPQFDPNEAALVHGVTILSDFFKEIDND